MITYQVESHNCHLQVYERGNTNSQIAILFLHGGPGSGANAIMELWAFKELELNYPCIYFDQRGSGVSNYDISQGLTLQDIVHDVYVIIEHIKKNHHYDEIILWGGSFGGYLAALCLEKYPQLVDRCILSSPAITFNRNQSLEFFHRMQKQYQKRLNAQDTFEVPEIFFSHPEVRKFIFSSMNPSKSLKHICAMGSWFYLHTFEHFFKDIQIPVLVLQGKDDLICKAQNIEEEMKTNKNKCIHYLAFEHCGHAVFEDKKEEFIESIIHYIGGR